KSRGIKPMTAQLQLVRPNNENRSVRAKRRIPTRPSNRDLRPREYLTPSEVEKLISTARKGRYGHRDATLILVAYRHGLRAVELCDLEWSQVATARRTNRTTSCSSKTMARRPKLLALDLSRLPWKPQSAVRPSLAARCL